jgi:hypothetical protein
MTLGDPVEFGTIDLYFYCMEEVLMCAFSGTSKGVVTEFDGICMV